MKFGLSRRDSFITHRAFCDALAEETARVNASNSFLGYSMMGNSQGVPGISMMTTTHFPSMLKPISHTAETNHHQAPRGLSLWMPPTQTHQDTTINNNNNNMFEIHHQLGSLTSSSSSGSILYGNNHPLVSCSNPQLMNNWVFGSNNNNSNKNNNTHRQDQLISVPSLYSSQHQQSHQASSANMSATALLQKAAQIGATSTDTSFLGTLGLKCSNSSSQEQQGNKLCGMYGAGSSVLVETENPAKRRKIQQRDGMMSNGEEQTRDFLGVGVESICHAAPINGWI